MKKIITFLILASAMFTLMACNKPSEGPDSLKIALHGLNGSGTLKDPYLLTINQTETQIKVLELDQMAELELISGIIKRGKFQVEKTSHLTAKVEENQLILTGDSIGEGVLRVKGVQRSSSVYIQYKVVKDVYKTSLKILAIGNSFSEDSTKYLWNIANSYGITNLVIGNLYIGSATLSLHWNNAQNGASNYTYYKNTDGTWKTSPLKRLDHALADEEWDIVTLQQGSGSSGLENTIEPYLTNLIQFVKNSHGKTPLFMWHMTWAYAKSSSHSEFPNYERNQEKMFQMIVETVKQRVLVQNDIHTVIPSGTVIQNLRTSIIGENVTRDGYHLNELGRYATALLWFKTITGYDIDQVSYIPEGEFKESHLPAIKQAVNEAYRTLFTITEIG